MQTSIKPQIPQGSPKFHVATALSSALSHQDSDTELGRLAVRLSLFARMMSYGDYVEHHGMMVDGMMIMR